MTTSSAKAGVRWYAALSPAAHALACHAPTHTAPSSVSNRSGAGYNAAEAVGPARPIWPERTRERRSKGRDSHGDGGRGGARRGAQVPQQDPLPVDGLLHCLTPFLGCSLLVTTCCSRYSVLPSSRAGSDEVVGLFVGGEATAAPPWWVGKGNGGGFTTKFEGEEGRTPDGKPERRPGLVVWDYGRRESRWSRAPGRLGIAAALLPYKPCAVWARLRVRTDRADRGRTGVLVAVVVSRARSAARESTPTTG